MSFKFLFLISLLLPFLSCGVKSDPIPPQDTLLPSYEAQFTNIPQVESVDDDDKAKIDNDEKEAKDQK